MAGADSGILELPYGVTGDVSANRFVKLTGDQSVIRCDTAGEDAEGVAQQDITFATYPKALTDVQILGVAWVEAGAAITRRALVQTDVNGRAITATSTNKVLGKALKAAANLGDLIPVLLVGGVHWNNGS